MNTRKRQPQEGSIVNETIGATSDVTAGGIDAGQGLQPDKTKHIGTTRLTAEATELLIGAARDAQAVAYAPYSLFPVGAAVLLSDGEIVSGCNIENASFGLTVCAERVAVFSAVAGGRMDIVAIALMTVGPSIYRPCGACRQVIAEFSRADHPVIIISATNTGAWVTETIADLLPQNFTLL